MEKTSELAFYDVGLEPWSIPKDTEKSEDSQRVLYEGHDPISSKAEEILPSAFIIPSQELTPSEEASTSDPKTFDLPFYMQGITKYTGGGGSILKNFIRELRAAYNHRKNTPSEHGLDGFGEWEFISQLGTVMGGEAKDVHSAWVDKWDFENPEN